jgi:hypothetical protein
MRHEIFFYIAPDQGNHRASATQHRPTEVLPDLPLPRPCRRTAGPSSREKVPLENHALFFAVPTGVIQEIGL